MANEFKVRKGLIVQGSGSTGDNIILDVQGNQGQLFSITDSLSGSLFTVSDISGIPILDVDSGEIVKIGTFGNEGIIVNGSNVTSSGAISASGTITANVFIGDGSNLSGVTTFSSATVSGSFTSLSASIASDVATNTAKLTANTSNVTSAGALMDSEVTSLALIKGLTAATISGSISATSVAAAGALMDSEMTDLAGVKGVTISTLQSKPSEGAFANGDKTKLDGIEDSANVTDTSNVTAAGALMDSEVTSLALIKGLTAATISGSLSATSVAAAGALMDSEVTSLALIKGLTAATISGSSTSLSSSVASDVATNTAKLTANTSNVTSAGALMDSEVTSLALIKGLTATTISGSSTSLSASVASDVATNTAKLTANTSNVTSAGALMDSEVTSLALIKGLTAATISGSLSATSVAAAGALMDSEMTDLAGVKGVTISTLQSKPSEGAFANGDKTKLDGISTSADVTDSTTVAAAGALMDSEVTSLALIKGLTATTISGSSTSLSSSIASDVATNTAKLTANTSNVTSAGALMDSEVTSLALIKGLTAATISGSSTSLSASVASDVATNTAKLTANTSNVTSAGALMDSEVTSLALIKGLTAATISGSLSATSVAAAGALMDSEVTSLALVKSITAATISGSISATSVAAAGALMDSEIADLGSVKAIDQQLAAGDSPEFVTENMTDGSNRRFMTDAQENKLDALLLVSAATISGSSTSLSSSIASDVATNTAKLTANTSNVTSAGALMDSEVTSLALIKGLTATTISGSISATSVAAAGALMDSEISSLSSVKAIDQDLDTNADVAFEGINCSEIVNTGQTSLGNSSNDAFTIVGNITASGNISASGTIVANKIESDNLFSHVGDANTGLEFASDTVHIQGNNVIAASFKSTEIELNLPITTNITSSGNISSSGTVQGLTGSFSALVGDTSQGTSLEVEGSITGSAFQGTKHLLCSRAFYVNDNPMVQNSVYLGNSLGNQPANWNDPQAVGGAITSNNLTIAEDDMNWGWILPFDISKIEVQCSLRPALGAGDDFTVVIYTTNRSNNSNTNLSLTRVANSSGVVFGTSQRYVTNDITYTANLNKGTMIFVGVGSEDATDAKNARGIINITVTQR